MDDIHPAGQTSYAANEKSRHSDEGKDVNDGKYGDVSSDADRIDVIAPTLAHHAGGEPNEKGDIQPGKLPLLYFAVCQLPVEVQLHRRLKSRHIAFVGLGSGIGVGVFVGIGAALAGAGPAGLLMAYIFTGMVIWTVIQCIGEIATLVSLVVCSTGPH